MSLDQRGELKAQCTPSHNGNFSDIQGLPPLGPVERLSGQKGLQVLLLDVGPAPGSALTRCMCPGSLI